MAELCVDQAAKKANLPARPCVTRSLQLHGAVANGPSDDPLYQYGSDASAVLKLAENDGASRSVCTLRRLISERRLYGPSVEMARTVEDVLARRFRVLFVDAQTAMKWRRRWRKLWLGSCAASNWISAELDRFRQLASRYLLDFAADASESSLTR